MYCLDMYWYDLWYILSLICTVNLLICIFQYSLQKGQRYVNTFYKESMEYGPSYTCPKDTLVIVFSLNPAIAYLLSSLSTSFNRWWYVAKDDLELLILSLSSHECWYHKHAASCPKQYSGLSPGLPKWPASILQIESSALT